MWWVMVDGLRSADKSAYKWTGESPTFRSTLLRNDTVMMFVLIVCAQKVDKLQSRVEMEWIKWKMVQNVFYLKTVGGTQ